MHFRFTRRWSSRLLVPCTLVALLANSGAQARGETDPGWNFSGFGSAGLTHADLRGADYSSSLLKGSGAGETSNWSPHVDSRLGAQLDVKANKQWSAVLQVIAEQRLDHSYRPVLEWANLKYQVTPDLSLRLGRIALPAFLAADYRSVGYAYPAVRMPLELYGAIPVTNSDGADLSYRWQSGRVKFVTQAMFGHTRVKLERDNRVKARGLAGFSQTFETGPWNGRLSVFSAEVTVNIGDELFAGLARFGPAGAALVRQYNTDHKRFTGQTIGLNYDPGHWFAIGEAGRVTTNSFLGDTVSMYASAGMRQGAFTPYLAYAVVKAKSPSSDPGLPLAGLPNQLAGAAAALNAGLNAVLMTVPTQQTASAGLRWDLYPDFALTAQYDRVRPAADSRGTLINLQPGYRPGQPVNVASVVLDFVF